MVEAVIIPARVYWDQVKPSLDEVPRTAKEISVISGLTISHVVFGLKYGACYGLLKESFRRFSCNPAKLQSLYSKLEGA